MPSLWTSGSNPIVKQYGRARDSSALACGDLPERAVEQRLGHTDANVPTKFDFLSASTTIFPSGCANSTKLAVLCSGVHGFVPSGFANLRTTELASLYYSSLSSARHILSAARTVPAELLSHE